MKAVERWPGRHPLCTCPELTWSNFATFDRAQCAGGSIAHPVIGADEARRIIADFQGQLRPEQFGTSMHYPYCQDGNCTGCIPPLPPLPEPDPTQDPFGLRR